MFDIKVGSICFIYVSPSKTELCMYLGYGYYFDEAEIVYLSDNYKTIVHSLLLHYICDNLKLKDQCASCEHRFQCLTQKL